MKKPINATWSQAMKAWHAFRSQKGRIIPYEKILKVVVDTDNG